MKKILTLLLSLSIIGFSFNLNALGGKTVSTDTEGLIAQDLLAQPEAKKETKKKEASTEVSKEEQEAADEQEEVSLSVEKDKRVIELLSQITALRTSQKDLDPKSPEYAALQRTIDENSFELGKRQTSDYGIMARLQKQFGFHTTRSLIALATLIAATAGAAYAANHYYGPQIRYQMNRFLDWLKRIFKPKVKDEWGWLKRGICKFRPRWMPTYGGLLDCSCDA